MTWLVLLVALCIGAVLAFSLAYLVAGRALYAAVMRQRAEASSHTRVRARCTREGDHLCLRLEAIEPGWTLTALIWPEPLAAALGIAPLEGFLSLPSADPGGPLRQQGRVPLSEATCLVLPVRHPDRGAGSVELRFSAPDGSERPLWVDLPWPKGR